MRIIWALIISICLIGGALSLDGCLSDNHQNSSSNITMKKIGIIQIVEHPSLNTIRESFINQLKEKGYKDGVNITIDYQNAQGDQANLKTISQKFVGSKYDLIVAIATPSAQAVAGESNDIPILFAACTDPISAGLLENLERPGKNITGTSDIISAEKNMQLAKMITPQIKTIGVLYNASETGALLVVSNLRTYAKNNDMKLVEATVTSTSEVQQAAQFLVNKTDAIFSPIDNTIASAMPLLSQVAIKAKKPLYVGADSMVRDGGLAACGINYVVLGKETADMAVEILNGKKAGDIPVKVMKDLNIYINEDTANDIGVGIPEEVIKESAQIFRK